MAEITLPGGLTPNWSSSSMSLQRGDALLETFSGATQATVFAKGIWFFSFTLPTFEAGSDFRDWKSALSQLSSFGNTFRVAPPDYTTPSSGYTADDALVKGGSQLGTSLDCDGVSNSTLILNEGDFFSVGSASGQELKIVTADATSDGSGNVTFNFEPALRASPVNDAAVRMGPTNLPRAECRLVDPRAHWDMNLLKMGQLRFEAMEAAAP